MDRRTPARPSKPIPFRIELRDFTRQFDANGLLHHFLDRNGLGAIPIDFVWSLIRTGRVVLILDGYDEMAQYMNARERRMCLEALATLSSGGARGILTSRPNYFSEAEEFHLLEALYRDLEGMSWLSARGAEAISRREQEVDDLISTHFLSRYERTLRDLDREQTEALVRRILAEDVDGASVVLGILERVFRHDDSGAEKALSGKPVIINYLLEVVEQLKHLPGGEKPELLTEWDIYTLVVENLMLRDLSQAGHVKPSRRRKFLQDLAVRLSGKENAVLDEDEFIDLIQRSFKDELRRFDASQRRAEVENLFQDLRRSGTLTRSSEMGRSGWRFSHNSLREFLVAEKMITALERGRDIPNDVPITDAMRLFVRSQGEVRLREQLSEFATLWGTRSSTRSVGLLLMLLWDGLLRILPEFGRVESLLELLGQGAPALDHVTLKHAVLSSLESPSELSGCPFSGSEFADVSLVAAQLADCDFTDCILESVDLSESRLSGSRFDGSILIDVDFRGAQVQGAVFTGISEDSSIVIESADGELRRLHGESARGYLKFQGAVVDPVNSYAELMHHPSFEIVGKICDKFNEHSPRQRLGVEQKGASARNVPFARRFVNMLVGKGLVEVRGGRSDVLYVTQAGRAVVSQVSEGTSLPPEIEAFLRSEE